MNKLPSPDISRLNIINTYHLVFMVQVTRREDPLEALPEVGRLEEELVDDFQPGDLVDNNRSNEQEKM